MTAFDTPDMGDMADAFASASAENEGAEAPATEAELGSPEQPTEVAPESGDEPVYTFLIDGEEQQLTHTQAQNALLMQSDYTRKTQALAAQRAELEQYEQLGLALDRDPARVIEALQQTYLSQEPDEDEYIDPDEQRWQEFDQFKAQLEEQAIQQEIDHTLAALQTEYGKFDENELIDWAVKHETPNLEVALSAMMYSKMREGAAKQKADQAALDAKRQAPPVAGGHGIQAGSAVPGAAPSANLDEAFAQAMAMHGAS